MIKIIGLTKSFNKKMLFWIPTLELTNTGLYLLIGENECGKTALMNILSLNGTSYQSTMLPDNMDVKKMTSNQKRKYKQKTAPIC